jgi:hypothetical protein
VPASEREPKTWFLLPRPEHADRLFTSATVDANLDEFAGASLVDGAASWGRAEGYYHRNMAQVQQMWQAREDFSKDLSLREVRPPAGSVGPPPTKLASALLFKPTGHDARWDLVKGQGSPNSPEIVSTLRRQNLSLGQYHDFQTEMGLARLNLFDSHVTV